MDLVERSSPSPQGSTSLHILPLTTSYQRRGNEVLQEIQGIKFPSHYLLLNQAPCPFLVMDL